MIRKPCWPNQSQSTSRSTPLENTGRTTNRRRMKAKIRRVLRSLVKARLHTYLHTGAKRCQKRVVGQFEASVQPPRPLTVRSSMRLGLELTHNPTRFVIDFSSGFSRSVMLTGPLTPEAVERDAFRRYSLAPSPKSGALTRFVAEL